MLRARLISWNGLNCFHYKRCTWMWWKLLENLQRKKLCLKNRLEIDPLFKVSYEDLISHIDLSSKKDYFNSRLTHTHTHTYICIYIYIYIYILKWIDPQRIYLVIRFLLSHILGGFFGGVRCCGLCFFFRRLKYLSSACSFYSKNCFDWLFWFCLTPIFVSVSDSL